ncbi:hypothetical protein [Pseudomonas monteilii]|uniref:hypothetical protein n=1 Tax=Pseudomonas monteilii TaxID=76759 RepID=UPI00383BDCB2
MDLALLVPLLGKFGGWLGPVAATVIGGYFTNRFTGSALDKKSVREARAARLTILKTKAEAVLASANKAIGENSVKELDLVDPAVRLYFDQGVVDAYEALRKVLDDKLLGQVISSSLITARGVAERNKLAKELNRFLQTPLVN